MKAIAFLLGGAAICLTGFARADNPVIVHEWGTFTCLQDEQGRAIGGINVDDEPVPDFVWGSDSVRRHERGNFGLPPYQDWIKGWRPADRDVTMRLETPVLYFYPPKGIAGRAVPPLEVHVDFAGGVLSQYYPYAESSGWSPNFPLITLPLADITSSLDWKNVQVGSNEAPVATDDMVWTTPRDVGASVLEVPSPTYPGGGQMVMKPLAEHFLFYRGLGHLDSPLRICSTSQSSLAASDPLSIAAQDDVTTASAGWLTEIRADGSCALADLSSFRIPGKTAMIPQGCRFGSQDFSQHNLARLKASMHYALVKEGLYNDEATAMLKTWELSYFKSPGLRFFYIVPRAWVDKVLPLKIEGAPTQITRVMVGRIELISNRQQATLARLSSGPCPDLASLEVAANNALAAAQLSDKEKREYLSGAKPVGDLGISVPPLVQDYLSLGRFRDALIVHEQAEHPSPALAKFIKDNGLVPPSN